MPKFYKGQKLSQEIRNKMSISKKGCIPWNKGKHHSEKTRKKMSESAIKRVKDGRNIFWKGGISKFNKKSRNLNGYQFWRKSCLIRDNFTCQKCKISGGKLNAHHINNYSEFTELRTKLNNGIILCENCHNIFHKIYGRNNNTKEQLDEFLIA
jgi:hypothetical protein